jgi:hypothetical protein
MIQVKVDDETAALLGSLKEKVELITEEGKVLGYFIPAHLWDEKLQS